MKSYQRAAARLKAELELRAGLKQVEGEMAAIVARIRKIDDVLNQNLATGTVEGLTPIGQYLGWLGRVEAIGLPYVNANIVTQRLRVFFTGPHKGRTHSGDPAVRMKAVKGLLEKVRQTEQASLLMLRHRRGGLQGEIVHLARDRSGETRPGSVAAADTSGMRSIGWLQLVVALAALLAGSILLDTVRPEVVHYLRTHLGLQAGTTMDAPGQVQGVTPGTPRQGGVSLPQ